MPLWRGFFNPKKMIELLFIVFSINIFSGVLIFSFYVKSILKNDTFRNDKAGG